MGVGDSRYEKGPHPREIHCCKRGFGFQTVASFAFVLYASFWIAIRSGRFAIPTVVMEIPEEVRNLKDRRSDLYEVRVKK